MEKVVVTENMCIIMSNSLFFHHPQSLGIILPSVACCIYKNEIIKE